MIHIAWTTIRGGGRIRRRTECAQLDEWPIEIHPGVFVRLPPGYKVHKNQERMAYISSDTILHYQLADRSIELIKEKV